jgi:RND superfamily putative drug exporter
VAACLVLLALLASGLAGTRYGLSQTEQFRTRAESIDGLKTLAEHFPAGASDPVSVVAAAPAAEAVRAAAAGTSGVASARVGERADRLARVDVVLTASPDTAASYTALRALRERVHAVPGADALVGGSVATNLDTRDAAARDQRVIIPIVLAVVLLILSVLIRALVAPILMVVTVVISFAAALGAARYAFTHWLGYPALDVSVPLLAFLFLVALGVDYNIFLISRGREEAAREGTRPGIVTALAVTGGVITSAGILLAAVFAVLGVLPLIVLTELGIIVGLGVLLDTLIVRTVLMPALVTILGRRFWWPSALSRRDGTGTVPDERPAALVG